MVVKEICEQEKLENFVVTLTFGNTERLDTYCGKDKIIRIYNNFQFGLAGNTMLTIPDGYTLDDV